MPVGDLVVTSWNVLADAYAYPERYAYTDPGLLTPASRHPRIVEVIRELLDSSDVVTLQEVEPPLWALIQDRLHGVLGTAVYAGHATRPDGVALLSRRASSSTLHDVIEQRGVASAVFELDRAPVTVATTHLPLRETPKRPMVILSAVLDELTDGHAVLAFDANATWSSPVLEPARARGWLAEQSPPTSFWRGDWVDADLIIARHAAVRVRRERFVDSPPNASWPSDHLPVTGVVDFANVAW